MVSLIADSIGRKALASALNVQIGTVHKAVREGCFPASWYKTVRRLAAANGLSIQDEMFAFKGLSRSTAELHSERENIVNGKAP